MEGATDTSQLAMQVVSCKQGMKSAAFRSSDSEGNIASLSLESEKGRKEESQKKKERKKRGRVSCLSLFSACSYLKQVIYLFFCNFWNLPLVLSPHLPLPLPLSPKGKLIVKEILPTYETPTAKLSFSSHKRKKLHKFRKN